jgi:hypothetical protein
MEKSKKICHSIFKGKNKLIILFLFLSKLSYGADEEIKISIELNLIGADNNIYFDIKSDTPVFIDKDFNNEGKIVFNTPVKMKAGFERINQFRISVKLNKDAFSYLKNFDKVEVIYPRWLVPPSSTITYDSNIELDAYDKLLLEKAWYSKESQIRLYGSELTESDLEGGKFHYSYSFSNLDVKSLVSKVEN